MKALIFPVLVLLPTFLLAQSPDATGLQGENFSLQGALDLFSRSKNLDGFEQALNDPAQHVNNLDLNNDGQVDYLRVVDHREGDVHAIILQDPVNGSESQDVAVIELEKTGSNTAQARIVGDEALYGPGVSYEKFTSRNGASSAMVVDVWGWPSVRYIYGPSYAVWTSPWYWGYYPRWYRPWHPYPVHVYYGYTSRYRPYYRPARTIVYRQADVIYVDNRRSSSTMLNRPRPTNGEPRSQGRTKPSSNNVVPKAKIQGALGSDRGTSPMLKKQPKVEKEPRASRRATRRADRGEKKNGGK